MATEVVTDAEMVGKPLREEFDNVVASTDPVGVLNTRQDYYAKFRVNSDRLEFGNLVECVELIVRSALQRHESRGLHYSRDYPDTLPVSFPTVVVQEVRSRNKAVQSLGLWRDMPR